MAKRFTDTEKWDRPWFRNIKKEYKILWQFILDKCDIAGVWYVDFNLANFMTGIKFNRTEAEAALQKQIEVRGDRWLIKDFVSFQYGNLTETNKLFLNVQRKLEEFKDGASMGDSMEHLSPSNGAKDKNKDRDKDISSLKPLASKQPFHKPTAAQVTEYAKSISYAFDGQKFVDFYESKGWMVGKSPMRDWKAAVRTWKSNGYEKGGSNGNGNHVAGAAAPAGSGPRIID